MLGPIVSQHCYKNDSVTSYYPYALPSTLAPPTPAPSPSMPPPPLPQDQLPPWNQVYAQQITTNPPNPKRSKGKGNHNKKTSS